MPPVTKQTVPNRNSRKADPDDILSESFPVTELISEYLKVCIYGQNRVGKTTLAAEFPKPMLVVSFEPNKTGGGLSIADRKGIQFIRLTESLKGPALCKQLVANPKSFFRWADKGWQNLGKPEGDPWKTVVMDGITSLQDVVLQELMGEPFEQLNWGKVGEDTYRERSEITRERTRPFLNLECNTIILGKEKDHNSEKGNRKAKLLKSQSHESYIAAQVGQTTAEWIHDNCDYIGRLSVEKELKLVKQEVVPGEPPQEEWVETGQIVRRLRTLPHPNFAAGFRSVKPDSVPEYIEAKSPKEMYDKIMKVIRGEKI